MTVVYLPRFLSDPYFLLKLTFTLRDPKQAPLETQRGRSGDSGYYSRPQWDSSLAHPERGCDLLMKPLSPTKAGTKQCLGGSWFWLKTGGTEPQESLLVPVTMYIYMLSHVCYFPNCSASLNFICNTVDPISLSWGKSVTHVLWDTETPWFVTWPCLLLLLVIQNLSQGIIKMGGSFRTLNLPIDAFVARQVVLHFLWRTRAAKQCVLKIALEFLHFVGFQDVHIPNRVWLTTFVATPKVWGGDEFSHLSNLWLGKYPRYCRGRREILLQEEKKCICMNCF